jgi:hypothetical protein
MAIACGNRTQLIVTEVTTGALSHPKPISFSNRNEKTRFKGSQFGQGDTFSDWRGKSVALASL